MPVGALVFWEDGGNTIYDYGGRFKYSASGGDPQRIPEGIDYDTSDYADFDILGTIDFSRGVTVVMRFAAYDGTDNDWKSALGQWKTSTNERSWTFVWADSTAGNYDGQRLAFGVSADGTFQANGAASFPALTNYAWYDVAGIFDNSYVTSVLDGAIIESNAYIGPTINSSVGITLNHATGSTKYPGSKFAYIYVFNQPLTLSQVRNIRSNPYGMVEPIRRPAIWSIPSGGAINFSGTSGIQTSTKGAALAVIRPLSGTSAMASATTSAILAILRALSGTSGAQSSTTSAALALIRALDGTAGGSTQTSSPILSILRAFSGTSTLQSATSNAILAIARALVGTAALQSSTSDAQMTLEGLITFLGTAAGVTQTKDAILAVARDLSGTSAGQSTVTDAVLAILRPLAGTSAAQTETTDAALTNLLSLSGTAAGQSATTDAAMALLRSFVGTAAINSATSEAVLAILRELEGSADMASSTSEAIMALAALGVIVDTILESLTPVRTVESLTPVRTVESI